MASGDCELQQVLRMSRHRNSSEALVHALEFEAAKSASRYINGFVPSHCNQKVPVSHCRYDGCRKTMLSDKQFKSSRESQRFEKDRRPKCYNCGKRGHLHVDCWEKKIQREESDRTNWRSQADVYKRQTLQCDTGIFYYNVMA